jgi:hypothetical protein
MKEVFNPSFFNFLFGFMSILALSFVTLFAIGFYQVQTNGMPTASVSGTIGQ